MIEMSCGECRFFREAEPWEAAGFDESGFCRRHSPRARWESNVPEDKDGYSLHGQTFARWPLVFADEWCGEFQPR